MAPGRRQGGPKYCKCKKMSTPTSLVLLFECTEAKCGKGLFLIYKLIVLPEIRLLLHANQHVTCASLKAVKGIITIFECPLYISCPLFSQGIFVEKYRLEDSFILTWHNCSGSLSSAVPSLLQCYCLGIPTQESTKKKDIGTFF